MMEEMLTTFKTDVAKAIQLARVKLDMTQEELAELAEITPQFLSRLENARKTASVETYIKLASALQMQFVDLLSGSNYSLPTDEMLFMMLGRCSDFEKRLCVKVIDALLTGIREK
jgi:transcriptional regulator with XRE-family HTH domain